MNQREMTLYCDFNPQNSEEKPALIIATPDGGPIRAGQTKVMLVMLSDIGNDGQVTLHVCPLLQRTPDFFLLKGPFPMLGDGFTRTAEPIDFSEGSYVLRVTSMQMKRGGYIHHSKNAYIQVIE